MKIDLPYEERSAWVNAAVMLALGIYYYAAAFGGETLGPAATLGLLFRIVVVVVVVQVIGHIVMAVTDTNIATDERDRLIAARAGSIGGFALAAFVFTTIAYALFADAIDPRTQVCDPVDMAVAAHLLVMGMIAAELVKAGAQLVLYRTGV